MVFRVVRAFHLSRPVQRRLFWGVGSDPLPTSLLPDPAESALTTATFRKPAHLRTHNTAILSSFGGKTVYAQLVIFWGKTVADGFQSGRARERVTPWDVPRFCRTAQAARATVGFSVAQLGGVSVSC